MVVALVALLLGVLLTLRVVVALVALLVGLDEVDDARQVQRGAVLAVGLLDGLVDRGLERVDVDDEVGALHVRDLARGQLEVVRLAARSRQVLDRVVVAGDPVDQELERVGRGHHGGPAVVTTGAARDEEGGEQEGRGDQGGTTHGSYRSRGWEPLSN